MRPILSCKHNCLWADKRVLWEPPNKDHPTPGGERTTSSTRALLFRKSFTELHAHSLRSSTVIVLHDKPSSTLAILGESNNPRMVNERFDIVIYGATGYTGAVVLENLVKSEYSDVTYAVAGRSEAKLKATLKKVSSNVDKDLTDTKMIVADSSKPESLAEMAKHAKVIINAVGPYRLHGEAVVKAAVENGASHVDISGEPAWLERMQMTYGKQAEENGVYIVGACGWDSIPCDLGVNFIKKNFGGDLNHVESFVQLNTGDAGYSFNAGTYQTLILGIHGAKSDGLGKIRKEIMPVKVPRSQYKLPKRPMLWQLPSLGGYALPFMGADKSVVNRSQYYDYTANEQRPVLLETYIRVQSLFWSLMLMLWLVVFQFMVQFEFTRKILQKYPDQCSFYMFKNSGPTREQMEQASFTYWFFGTGWDDILPYDQEHPTKPTVKKAARCDGPDAGYIATSFCVLSAALTVLKDKNTLPPKGGVFTTAAAFAKTDIYTRLEKFGIRFSVVDQPKEE
ncbi:hypothetical protein QR680_005899 [Steinernema hermaphroditum]|uniref:Saccharopine dehydrogenase NADP binding domain-containing protein n=1 Tax=Steinernema hermaphroditum TaxID=289476 RepID=A0AA39HVV4_9BILA|nr:hypothetical protein QR680_005899 [Steinernema hermaphroditum]